MDCGIFIRTYYKDCERLEFTLRSIRKFCSGFSGVTVACPENSIDLVSAVTKSTGFDSPILCNHLSNDFIGQQITKLNADKYCKYDYICHIDSDCIFVRETNPSDLFLEGRPLMLMAPYNYFYGARHNVPWQTITSKFVGRQVDYEFMRRFPLTYPRQMYIDLRDHFHNFHNYEINEVWKHIWGDYFSEFNLMGAFSFYSDSKYHSFSDVTINGVPEVIVKQYCLVSSRDDRTISASDRDEIERILTA
ncbi:hypothetical protein SAMN02982917_2184 [Azospirillum oryzae]|uniref:Nucleotide-diphospho-sugar transferase domain-containing protein n=1 Tax=Azospirillum oryzae TaxID=286727 RepID=A0A1X7EZI0_9PROT|nr:DUF6492 family protein [Azospirillum oryzae]SMF43084.1 hypothetical protein SAMN02982917_2184 [Azospirillum oryzae]